MYIFGLSVLIYYDKRASYERENGKLSVERAKNSGLDQLQQLQKEGGPFTTPSQVNTLMNSWKSERINVQDSAWKSAFPRTHFCSYPRHPQCFGFKKKQTQKPSF